MLKERKERQFSAGFARPEDYVFATRTGAPLGQRNLLRGFYAVLRTAGLDSADGRPRPRWHDLRHTCASVFIAKGIPVTSVAHHLGHANPGITLTIYAHLFDAAEHAERVAGVIETAASGERRRKTAVANAGDSTTAPTRRMSRFIPLRRPQATSRDPPARFASRRSPVRSRYAPSSSMR
jgi:hypothetical protein